MSKQVRIFLTTVLALVCGLTGCASTPPRIFDNPPIAFAVSGEASDYDRYAPIIMPARYERSFNRVGTVVARYDSPPEHNTPKIAVDSAKGTFYTLEQAVLSTNHARYRNLIYRIHFTEVPYRLIPFTLTAGRHGGLIVIITLDVQNRPVLITAAHTCGCYLAIIPTSYLPTEAYPPNWNMQLQDVYGERLPGKLDYPGNFETYWRPAITIRDGTHRIADVRLVDIRSLTASHHIVPVATAPMATLEQLALPDGRTTSFFHTEGWRKGYVKESIKPWEFLFISWWALDPFVGVDKALGDPNETGAVFYTSLKPWYRQSSNLWYFAEFLTFWGWNL